MIIPSEARPKSQFIASLNAEGELSAELQPIPTSCDPQSGTPLQIDLAGAHILIGLVGSISFVGLLLWALLKLWLFE